MIARAEDFGKLLIDDLDDLLPRGKALQDCAIEGPLLHRGDEITGDAEIHVGFQQGTAHLTQGVVDILFAEPAFALQPIEYSGESVGEIVKHIGYLFPAEGAVGDNEGYHKPHCHSQKVRPLCNHRVALHGHAADGLDQKGQRQVIGHDL